MLKASCRSNSSTVSRLGSAASVLGCRTAPNFAGSTSALLPGSSTASQRSIIFMTSAGGTSSGTLTGSPPASSTARSYCGIARSAYSRSPPCGSGMAIRGFISTRAFNSIQRLGLAIVTHFHEARRNKNDGRNRRRSRKRNMPVRKCHVRMSPAQPCSYHGSRNRKQQADRKRQQRDDERHQHHPQRDHVPAGLASRNFR